MGLTPRQNSTGSKERLGGITEQGNQYLRKLLALAATSFLRIVSSRTGALAEWIVQLRARKPARAATVALANKLARIIWTMLNSGELFRKESFLWVKAAAAAA